MQGQEAGAALLHPRLLWDFQGSAKGAVPALAHQTSRSVLAPLHAQHKLTSALTPSHALSAAASSAATWPCRRLRCSCQPRALPPVSQRPVPPLAGRRAVGHGPATPARAPRQARLAAAAQLAAQRAAAAAQRRQCVLRRRRRQLGPICARQVRKGAHRVVFSAQRRPARPLAQSPRAPQVHQRARAEHLGRGSPRPAHACAAARGRRPAMLEEARTRAVGPLGPWRADRFRGPPATPFATRASHERPHITLPAAYGRRRAGVLARPRGAHLVRQRQCFCTE